jgi:hypothetical protein
VLGLQQFLQYGTQAVGVLIREWTSEIQQIVVLGTGEFTRGDYDLRSGQFAAGRIESGIVLDMSKVVLLDLATLDR